MCIFNTLLSSQWAYFLFCGHSSHVQSRSDQSKFDLFFKDAIVGKTYSIALAWRKTSIDKVRHLLKCRCCTYVCKMCDQNSAHIRWTNSPMLLSSSHDFWSLAFFRFYKENFAHILAEPDLLQRQRTAVCATARLGADTQPLALGLRMW